MTYCGELVQCERPVWEPLIALVGLNVVGCFMWMHEIELDDGLGVHAYKSIATRRYLHLGVDGRAFIYRSPGHYAEVTLHAALEEAFRDWERTLPPPPDPDAVRVLLGHRSGASQETHHEHPA